MRARIVHPLAALAAAALIVSCGGSTAPALRLADIIDISAPGGTFGTDTLHVSFDWLPQGCGSLDHVDVRETADSASFAVWTRAGSEPCAQLVALHHFAAVVPPPHHVPYTFLFREPGGADSVRVAQPAP